MVTRYKQTGYDRGLEPAHDGSLVSFSDFARLEAENRDLRAKLETVEAETRERCAKVADYVVQRAHRDWHDRKKAEGAHDMAEELAAAIRNMEPRHD